MLTTEAARRATTIHCRVPAANHDDALADLADVLEPDVCQPFHADMDMGACFSASGKLEIQPAWRPSTDEN